jgi:hypothetical protein
MHFQLRQLVLWPRRTGFAPRVVRFEPGTLNVISGISRTGKSAIIPIIDYCLGAAKCTIPVNTIRDTCEWFGIVVDTDEGQKLFARREPGSLQATSEMFTLQANEVVVPDRIAVKNTNSEAVKRSLDQMSGLTTLEFDIEGLEGRLRDRPSFRDLTSFMFQPQNVIANPNVLFYKADTIEHREKLRTIFPYVLGAVSASILAKRDELKQLRRELRRKQQELATVREISERWRAEALARVAEARELGLIPHSSPQPRSHAEAVGILRELSASSRDRPNVTGDSVSEAVAELAALQEEEANVSQELSRLRRRYAEMVQLKNTAAQYRAAIAVQQDRLHVSAWLRQQEADQHACPICGNDLNGARATLDELLSELQRVEETSTRFGSVPASFDREFERVRAEVSELTERLRGIRIRQAALEKQSAEARQRQYSLLMASRFLGRLEADLKTLDSVGQDSDLTSEVADLQQRVSALEAEISEAQIQRLIRNALARVNANVSRLMPVLDAERPNDPVALSETELTIKVIGGSREDFLWEIGSGSNWLSYHIATTLGLHQYFLTITDSPVPNLIVYDQPSQVYFPKRLAGIDTDESGEPVWQEPDVAAVRKALDTIARVIAQAKGRLQAIVLDHASEPIWRGLGGIHLVEDWRNGRTLVPKQWEAG